MDDRMRRKLWRLFDVIRAFLIIVLLMSCVLFLKLLH